MRPCTQQGGARALEPIFLPHPLPRYSGTAKGKGPTGLSGGRLHRTTTQSDDWPFSKVQSPTFPRSKSVLQHTEDAHSPLSTPPPQPTPRGGVQHLLDPQGHHAEHRGEGQPRGGRAARGRHEGGEEGVGAQRQVCGRQTAKEATPPWQPRENENIQMGFLLEGVHVLKGVDWTKAAKRRAPSTPHHTRRVTDGARCRCGAWYEQLPCGGQNASLWRAEWPVVDLKQNQW